MELESLFEQDRREQPQRVAAILNRTNRNTATRDLTLLGLVRLWLPLLTLVAILFKYFQSRRDMGQNKGVGR